MAQVPGKHFNGLDAKVEQLALLLMLISLAMQQELSVPLLKLTMTSAGPCLSMQADMSTH